MDAFTNFLTVTDNINAFDDKKKAMIKAVEVAVMIDLFKHVGGVQTINTKLREAFGGSVPFVRAGFLVHAI